MSDILRLGAKGDAVATAQRLLNFHLSLPKFPPLTDFGNFDTETRRRVQIYQRMAGLSDDGEIGPLTTHALLPVARLTLNGTVSERSLLPPVPGVGLNPSLRDLPRVGGPQGAAPTPYFSPPDWLSAPDRHHSLYLDNVQLSAGNETDLPKATDSAPMQFDVEFQYLTRRDSMRVIAHGVQLSYTPESDDGHWIGEVYGKLGLNNWPLTLRGGKLFASDWPGNPSSKSDQPSKPGDVSLFNPFLVAYVKKALDHPGHWTFGGAIGNETDVVILSEENEDGSSYNLQAYLNFVPLQLDFFNIDDQSVTLKAASTLGLGFKLIWSTPQWKGPAPGVSPP